MTTLLSPRIHIFAAEFNLEVGQVTAHTPPRIIQFWQFLRRTGFSVQCPSYTTNHTRMRPWRCVVSSVSHQPSPMDSPFRWNEEKIPGCRPDPSRCVFILVSPGGHDGLCDTWLVCVCAVRPPYERSYSSVALAFSVSSSGAVIDEPAEVCSVFCSVSSGTLGVSPLHPLISH